MRVPAPDLRPCDVDDAAIDGNRLRLAREAKGLSPSEAAHMLTLSRTQVTQIESGGMTAFYSPGHKLLAARKYATAFGIEPQSVLWLDPLASAVDDEPALQQSPDVPELAAADGADEQSVRISRSLTGVALRSSDGGRVFLGTIPAARVIVRLLVFTLLVVSASMIAATTVRGALDRLVMTPTAPLADRAWTSTAPKVTSAMPAAAAAVVREGEQATLADTCPHASGAVIPSWTPAYVRKPGTRLFVGGPVGTPVCVTDHSGRVSHFVLRQGPLQVIDGRPPYLVHSPALDMLQIYLQGLKVRVPPQAQTIKLLPGEHAAATHDANSAAQPES